MVLILFLFSCEDWQYEEYRYKIDSNCPLVSINDKYFNNFDDGFEYWGYEEHFDLEIVKHTNDNTYIRLIVYYIVDGDKSIIYEQYNDESYGMISYSR